MTAVEAAAADLVVVTIPVKAVPQVPVEPLAGKTVIDTNNYYPQQRLTSAGLLQAHLPESQVVKAFNHIRSAQITTDATPTGTPGRPALAIAGDDAVAKAQVTQLIDEFGSRSPGQASAAVSTAASGTDSGSYRRHRPTDRAP